jgi:hypothetical protein
MQAKSPVSNNGDCKQEICPDSQRKNVRSVASLTVFTTEFRHARTTVLNAYTAGDVPIQWTIETALFSDSFLALKIYEQSYKIYSF